MQLGLPTNPPMEGVGSGRQAPPCVLIVFGASGDLTKRKLLPAIAALAHNRQLPPQFSVIGLARTKMSDDDFRKLALEAAPDAGPEWAELVKGFRYQAGDFKDQTFFDRLKKVMDEIDHSLGTAGNRVFYLATVPNAFGEVAAMLAKEGLNRPNNDNSFVRIVVEKPYGRDLASAGVLDTAMHAAFDESQIYRIDHYLAKETVQNILALRFANAIFEPIWNRRYVDHVQVTVAEELGVGTRAGYYETAGALRDIVQNHALQVLAVCAMEPPALMEATGIRDEKVKALRAIRPYTEDEVISHVVRAQYTEGWSRGKRVNGYLEEKGVQPGSQTETYVAMKLGVDNWRWDGVPFYLRTGKRLPKRYTEVVLSFRPVPHLAFSHNEARGLHPNALVLRIQPNEGITLRFGAKAPGATTEIRDVLMDFSYGSSFTTQTADAYQRLLLDAMAGDPMLFIRSDEVEQAWNICDPILGAWATDALPMARYEAGTWGPVEADRLLTRTGRQWRRP